jgi:hypothetical protein
MCYDNAYYNTYCTTNLHVSFYDKSMGKSNKERSNRVLVHSARNKIDKSINIM